MKIHCIKCGETIMTLFRNPTSQDDFVCFNHECVFYGLHQVGYESLVQNQKRSLEFNKQYSKRELDV